jgi:hypothetical protein
MNFDPSNLRAFDLETPKIMPGRLAPKIVCGSYAEPTTKGFVGKLLHYDTDALRCAESLLCSPDDVMVGANIAYDLACSAAADDDLLPFIVEAIREGRVYDILLAQSLDAIAGGHLGLDPRTFSELRHPSTNKPTKRYSLEVCVDLVCDRRDAKERDAWRTSYAMLDDIPRESWPEEARQYPIDDAVNTLEVAVRQLTGWVRGKMDVYTGPARNLGNMAEQVETAFWLHLGACWGLRSDPSRVAALTAEVTRRHEQAVERFRKLGWVRPDGSEDTVAIKKAIARAYGTTGTCSRCKGSGLVRPIKEKECRGVKLGGRYKGCLGPGCVICSGSGKIAYEGSETTCKGADGGCDGTGFDLGTAPMLPRTDKGGIKTDRDAAMESGDDEVSDYADNIFEKIRSTYAPYLRKGFDKPLNFSPNVLVATGRCSYEGAPVHQFPRAPLKDDRGKVIYFEGAPLGTRECIIARPGYVLCSTDYAAGELCTLAQVTTWVVGHSKMAEIINETKDPGSLHSFLGAKMLGIDFEEMKRRLKAKDRQAKDFRQSSKPANFGFPGGLGSPTLVITNRRLAAGTTTLPSGVEVAGIRFCVLLAGAERCGVEKITQWGKRGIPPVCKACVEIVEEVLKKTFFDAYPEVREYLDWISEKTREDGVVPQVVWNAKKQKIEVARRRGGCGYTDGANSMFQGLLADVGKRAYCQMSREGYLGVKDDGSPSPLAGARFPLFLHDEPLAELRRETAHVAAPRIAEIMVQSGYDLAPDVFWKAEPALSLMMSKDAEPVYDDAGNLTLWMPKAA